MRNVFIISAFFIILTSCSTLNVERETILTLPSPETSVEVQAIKAELDKSKDLTFGKIVLEKSKFEDVFRLFGHNKKNERHYPSYLVYYSCYVGINDKVINFKSDSVMGGDVVWAIEISELEEAKENNCLKIDAPVPQLNRRGIGIGRSKKDILRILGEPSLKVSEREWEYQYISKKKDHSCNGDLDVHGIYRFVFSYDKVAYLWVSQNTTC